MLRVGPSVQVKEAVAALKAVGFKRRDFRVSASDGRGRYGDAVTIFLIPPERIMLLIDEMVEAGFYVSQLVVGGRVVHINAKWRGTGGQGDVTMIDQDKIRAEAQKAMR